ncbi:MAG TPA: hypothetical protein VG347_02950 [Verrucomicrobiae bacterium]|nr:hypothetical protein [Verrucomicrobiae bacterium]
MTNEYLSYVAFGVTPQFVQDFIKSFSELETLSTTTTSITYDESSPRNCGIVIHIESERSFGLEKAFWTGQLQGYNKTFKKKDSFTSGNDFSSDMFRQLSVTQSGIQFPVKSFDGPPPWLAS